MEPQSAAMPRPNVYGEPRPIGVAFRMAPAERELFNAVAQARGETLTGFFRRTIAQEARRQGLPLPAPMEQLAS